MPAIRGDVLGALRDKRQREVIIPVAAGIHAALTSDNFTTQPVVMPGVAGAPQHPLSILAALPTIKTQAGTFEFNQLTGAFAYAADYQAAEGDTKPDQALPTNLVTVPIATVAVLSSVSEQVVMDQPAIETQLNNLLMYGVQQKLEAEVVAGAGGSGKIKGLLANGTAFAPTAGASHVDAISECAAHLQTIGWNPGAVLLAPADWHAMRISKSAGSGEYLAGSYNLPPTLNLWGVPVYASASVPAGKAVVLDTNQVALIDRMAVTLAVGYVGQDFAQNMLRLRAELRAGLAVFAPTAVQVVTLA